MHNTQPKKNKGNRIIVEIDVTKVARGPMRWPCRGGAHKDKRRASRNNQRVAFRNEQ